MTIVRSVEETYQAGQEFAATLLAKAKTNPYVICLYGDLGAGKTSFVKGMSKALDIAQDSISSPTFQYLNIYKGPTTLYHFDLYRLTNEETFLEMGFDEILAQPGLICIEWPERISSLLPSHRIDITLSHHAEGRLVDITGDIE